MLPLSRRATGPVHRILRDVDPAKAIDPLVGPAPDDAQWQALRRRAVRWSIGVAAVLALTKLVASLMSGSVSLLASLADSMADVAASSLALWSVSVAHRPADEEHRFGHGKAEALSSLVQAAFVGTSGVFVLYTGIARLLDPRPIEQTTLAIAVMVVSMFGSGLVVAIQARVLRQVRSIAIEADSLHYRGDLLANASVIVAIVLADHGGQTWADPVVGAAIAGYLFWSALGIVRGSIDLLMDRELSDEARARIEAIVEQDPDAEGVHDLRTRSLGQAAHVELHLELDGHMDLYRAHTITDRIGRAIVAAFPGSEVTIHTDPAGLPEDRLDDRIAEAEAEGG